MIEAEARGAWRELDARIRPYVERRIRSSADADDVVQDVFVRMQRGLSDLRDEERFGPWVYRVARSAIADHLRARARRAGREAAVDAELALPEPDVADRLEGELSECVALFVARLPSPYREAITLTELQGLTQKEAAELAGVSLSGMKSRVQRGRERIRQMFEECCEISLDCRGRVVGCEPRGGCGPRV